MRYLVCGPPCAGKTTWANVNTPDQPILDRDQIAIELGSPDPWEHPADIEAAAEQEFQRRLTDLPADATIIRSLPGVDDRQTMARKLGAQIVMIKTPSVECHQRATQDGRPAWTHEAIDKWWTIYRASLMRQAGIRL